jgi:hypothetical protein
MGIFGNMAQMPGGIKKLWEDGWCKKAYEVVFRAVNSKVDYCTGVCGVFDCQLL